VSDSYLDLMLTTLRRQGAEDLAETIEASGISFEQPEDFDRAIVVVEQAHGAEGVQRYKAAEDEFLTTFELVDKHDLTEEKVERLAAWWDARRASNGGAARG
jgi:hypothetical protein